jgi:hypothetical protein
MSAKPSNLTIVRRAADPPFISHRATEPVIDLRNKTLTSNALGRIHALHLGSIGLDARVSGRVFVQPEN